jgi:UDPglucose 6-dehydrogenase
MEINAYQRKQVILKLHDILGELKGCTVALMGLAFKQNTDDMRDAPSINIAEYCQKHGAQVRAYDPVAMHVARHAMPYVEMAPDPYSLVQDADAVIVVTPWNEFMQLDMARIKNAMRTPVMIDGRNLYDPAEMRQLGFTYRGIGRGYNDTIHE